MKLDQTRQFIEILEEKGVMGFPITVIKQGGNVTTSLKIAEVFGKRHDSVLRDINNMDCSPEFRLLNFQETPYLHLQNGQTYPTYEITKNGFSFLVMGYTGKKAVKRKEANLASSFSDVQYNLTL